tara:strand:+ start:506 stop:1060 length:555 start_codon:yes stop_codon:yes gene_type:complete
MKNGILKSKFFILFFLTFFFSLPTLHSSEDSIVGINIECRGDSQSSIYHSGFKFLDEKKVETKHFIVTTTDQATGEEKERRVYKPDEEIIKFYDFYKEGVVNYNLSKWEGRDVVYIDLKDDYICSKINGKLFKCNENAGIMRDNLASNLWNFDLKCNVVDDAFVDFAKYKNYKKYEPLKKKNAF